MITYYRDESVAVTSTFIQINGQLFRLVDLDYIWHREASPDWRVRGRTFGRGVLNTAMILAGFVGVIALVAIIAAAYGESKLAAAVGDLPIPRNTLLLLAVVLLLLGLVAPVWEWALHRVDDSYDKGNAIYEIWASIGGQELMLLRLSDATRFGKIYRSIERALEQH